MTNQIPDSTIKKEWRYVETPTAAEVEVGDIRLRPHWKGLSDTDTLRAVVRMAAAAPALYEALRKCQTYVELHTHEKRGVCGSLLDTIDAALSLVDHPTTEEGQTMKCQRCSTRDAIKNETFCLPCRQELDQQRRDQRRSAEEGQS